MLWVTHRLPPVCLCCSLRVPIENGEDPEDTYTDIPYEKGYALVCYLRHLVGSDQEFDAWLKVTTAPSMPRHT